MVSPNVTRQAARMDVDGPKGSKESHSPSKGRSSRNTRNGKAQEQATGSSSSSSKQSEELAKIGPWRLGKTLGKGSSGRVKLAKHTKTGKYAAVKIVPKRALIASASRASMNVDGKDAQQKLEKMLIGIEREIVIMKLIEHPNIMSLYDVWETHQDLYLVLEYVEGGELFDYLVSKGRLREEEALHYFQQIIFGVDYCHRFNICHRDLKPENLLLDRHRNIKIADFGMAALEPSNKLLETSCGSPHYASPEIVAGKHYHGNASDTWSAGVVLYALLTGRLPFDDENIRILLGKVKIGKFSMPQDIAPEAQDLIRRMLTVDPRKRITMPEIIRHPWFNKRAPRKADRLPPAPSPDQIERPVNSLEEVDMEILQNLQTLWHGADESEITKALLAKESNWEKTFYILLMKYRNRNLENWNEDGARPMTRASASNAATRHPKQFVASTAHTSMKTKRSTTRQSISSLAAKPSSPRHGRHRKAAPSESYMSPQKQRQVRPAEVPASSNTRQTPIVPAVPILAATAPIPVKLPYEDKELPKEPIPSVLNRPRHSSKAYDGVSVRTPSSEMPRNTNRTVSIPAPVPHRAPAPIPLDLPVLDIPSAAIILDEEVPQRTLSPINVPTVGDDRIQRFFQEVADTLHTMTAVQQRSVTPSSDVSRRISGSNENADAMRRISDTTQFDDAEDDRSAFPQPAYQVRRVTPVITRASRDARTVSQNSATSYTGQGRPISRVRTSYHSGGGSRPVSIVGAALPPMLPPLTLQQRSVYSQRSSAPPQTQEGQMENTRGQPANRKITAPVQGRNSAPGAPLGGHTYYQNANPHAPSRPPPPPFLPPPMQFGRQKGETRLAQVDKENLPLDTPPPTRIQWSEDTRKVSAATTADQSVYSDRTGSTSTSNKSGSGKKESKKHSWFASLFSFGPASYHLKSTGSVSESRLEAWRILRDLEVNVIQEDQGLLRCEALSLIDSDGTFMRPVQFRIEMGSFHSVSINRKGSLSKKTSVNQRRKSSITSVGKKSSVRDNNSNGTTPDGEGLRDGMIKVTFTQEKGSLASFKYIFTHVRRAWRLDEPVPAGIRLLPTPVVPRVVSRGR